MCWSLWGHKQLDTTEQLNNNCNKVPEIYWLQTIQICYFVVLEIRSPHWVTGLKSSGLECCVTSGHYREGYIYIYTHTHTHIYIHIYIYIHICLYIYIYLLYLNKNPWESLGQQGDQSS